jgi:uncharacterized protein (TIGR02453 family)
MGRSSQAKASAGAGGFSGFTPTALGFFRDLAEHQDRTWFQANRHIYEQEVLAPLHALVEALGAELPRRQVPLSADPLKAVFRIHRDVRFSRDKSPYKTHAGAVLSRDGTKGGFGLLYIHIDPAGSFAASGFHQPDPKALEALRQAMLDEPAAIQAALSSAYAAGCELMREDALTRLPRGFEHAAGSPAADLLKLRHLVLRRSIPASMLASPALVGTLADFAETALPLLRFGWDAL